MEDKQGQSSRLIMPYSSSFKPLPSSLVAVALDKTSTNPIRANQRTVARRKTRARARARIATKTKIGTKTTSTIGTTTKMRIRMTKIIETFLRRKSQMIINDNENDNKKKMRDNINDVNNDKNDGSQDKKKKSATRQRPYPRPSYTHSSYTYSSYPYSSSYRSSLSFFLYRTLFVFLLFFNSNLYNLLLQTSRSFGLLPFTQTLETTGTQSFIYVSTVSAQTTDCPNSPFFADADTNAFITTLQSWSDSNCSGIIKFEGASLGNYTLTDSYTFESPLSSISLDASFHYPDYIELVAAADKRHFSVKGAANFTATGIKFSTGDVSGGAAATAHDNAEAGCGGSIYANNAYVKVENCNFDSNWAQTGSAIYMQANSLAGTSVANPLPEIEILNTIFTENAALSDETYGSQDTINWYGGALALYGTSSTQLVTAKIGNSTSFKANDASSTYGGATVFFYANVDMRDSRVEGNTAWQIGGLEQSFGEATLTNVTVKQNIAEAFGGMRQRFGDTNIKKSLFDGNEATASQGGQVIGAAGFACWTGAYVSITDSEFYNNNALAGTAGAIYNKIATLLIERSIIQKNYASLDGGGLYVFKGSVTTVDHSDLTLNTVGSGGTGADIYENTAKTPLPTIDITCTKVDDIVVTGYADESDTFLSTCTPAPTSSPTPSPTYSPTSDPGCGFGKYINDIDNSCYLCPEGQYQNQYSGIVDGFFPTNCSLCTAGKYSVGGQKDCTECKLGTYSLGNTSACTPCPLGMYLPIRLYSSLFVLYLSLFVSIDLHSSLFVSILSIYSIGYYGNAEGLSSDACSGECGAGYYGNTTGQVTMTCNGPAAKGFYTLSGSTTAYQYACPAGKYADTTGSSSSSCQGSCDAGSYCPDPIMTSSPLTCTYELITYPDYSTDPTGQ